MVSNQNGVKCQNKMLRVLIYHSLVILFAVPVRRIRIGLLEVRQEVKAYRILLQKNLKIMGSSDATHTAVHELDDDFASFPLDLMEGFNALEEKLADPSSQEQLVCDFFLSMLCMCFF